jgi:hypothetical protein
VRNTPWKFGARPKAESRGIPDSYQEVTMDCGTSKQEKSLRVNELLCVAFLL